MSYPVLAAHLKPRPYSADYAYRPSRTDFNPGTRYSATDGRTLYVRSGCNDVLDVWQLTDAGEHVRVGDMTRSALADLLGR